MLHMVASTGVVRGGWVGGDVLVTDMVSPRPSAGATRVFVSDRLCFSLHGEKYVSVISQICVHISNRSLIKFYCHQKI
jgi:hypothetical protein